MLLASEQLDWAVMDALCMAYEIVKDLEVTQEKHQLHLFSLR